MDLFKKCLELSAARRPFALATVVRSTGSTPQKAGARAIFERDGAIWGTLGGGCLEAESRRRALLALDEGRDEAFDLSLDSDYGWDDGLICGGNVRVWVTVNVDHVLPAIETATNGVLQRRESGLLVLPFNGEATARWAPSCSLIDSPVNGAGDLAAIFESGKPAFVSAPETGEWFVEPLAPAPRLLIAGGGHVGKATAQLGKMLGFEVTVVDDRAAFANSRHIPEASEMICGDIVKELEKFPIAPDTYVVIVTRGHRHDADALEAVLRRGAAYVGMIGSKRKLLLIKKSLIAKGAATREELEAVYSPIGFDIGAKSVPEIAVSIAAQLVAARHKHSSLEKNTPALLSL